MTAKVFVEINGSRQEVTRQELFDLAKQGVVQPETRLFWGDQTTTVSTVRGIEFAPPKSETADTMENAMADLLMEGQSSVLRKQKKQSASVPKEIGVSPDTMAQVATNSTRRIESWFVYGAVAIGALPFVIYLITWLCTTSEQGKEALEYLGIGLFCTIISFLIYSFYSFSTTKNWSENPGCGCLGCSGFILIICFFLFISTISMTHEQWTQLQTEKQQEEKRNAPSSADEQAAIRYAKKVVQSQLKSPSTAKFVEWQPLAEYSRSTGRWRISGNVDAQNSFGATIRNAYIVEVVKTDGNWQTVRCVITE